MEKVRQIFLDNGLKRYAQLYQFFKKTDANKDDRLGLEEFSASWHANYPNPEHALTDADIKALFDTIDANHDGSVQFHELCTAVLGVQ